MVVDSLCSEGAEDGGAVVPPFTPSDEVFIKFCDEGVILDYFALWTKYYAKVNQPSVVPSIVEKAESVSDKEGSVSSDGDGESGVPVEQSPLPAVKETVPVDKVVQKKFSGSKTPWRMGELYVKTLSNAQVQAYGDGACYLHLVRAEHASDVYRKCGLSLDLKGLFQLPIKYLIPRADMRNKAVTVEKKRIHVSSSSNGGWSFYTVLQAAVKVGMKAPLLDGVDPGYTDLRVDPSFIVGGMAASVSQSSAVVRSSKTTINRFTTGVPGVVSWSFDDMEKAVVLRLPYSGQQYEVIKDKACLKVAFQDAAVEVEFPFSLTRQVVTWEVVGRVVKQLVISVTGVLVTSGFFPFSTDARTRVRDGLPLIAEVSPCDAQALTVDFHVVDTIGQVATVVSNRGVSEQRVLLPSMVVAGTSVCYWPVDIGDLVRVKTTLDALVKAKVRAVTIVGAIDGLGPVFGVQPSKYQRYHRWFELQEHAAVSLAAFSKVLVQSEEGYRQACRIFREEKEAGSLDVEMYSPGVDCRRHVVCVYVEEGAKLSSELIRELWSGEGNEYVLFSPDRQGIDVLL